MKSIGWLTWFMMGCSSSALAGSLQGLVTRSDDGQPVSGAQILIRGTGLQTSSGPDGSYSLPSVPNGIYGITCAAVGLVASSTGPVYLGTPNRDFSLDPPAADSFSIYGMASCSGIPCPGVLVGALQDNQLLAIGLSAPDGGYSIEGLLPGSYDLRAVALGHLVTDVPGVLIDIGPVEMPLELTPAPTTYRVFGVIGFSDNPLDRSGARVTCNGQTPAITTLTDRSGAFELLGVPAGLLSFSASHVNYRASSQIDVLIQQDQEFNLVLQIGDDTTPPSYRFSGRVALAAPDGGNPVDLRGSRVSVWRVDGTFQASASTDAQGRYAIESIPNGTYQAGAAREGYVPQILDPFDLNSDQNHLFSLEVDPTYDWGPGSRQGLGGCSHGSSNGSWFFWLGLLMLGWLRKTA